MSTIQIAVEVKPRQADLIRNPATVLWLGAGTKTGKTIGLALWVAQGILNGEPTAWCGPWAAKTRRAYEQVKKILEYAIQIGDVNENDTTMRLTSRSGGSFTGFTGDNADAIFGDAFKRFVIDEASRQKELSFTAALTTVSATAGQVKIGFNLDHGAKNWAIKNLLRVKAMNPAERLAAGEDLMTFPTIDEGFVKPEFIELMRSKMPQVMFDALYNAIIPESDIALFRNLDDLFVLEPLPGPRDGGIYVMGVDLARKRDWTVLDVVDVLTGDHVATDRFHEISWTLQYERAAALYRKWRCSRALVDQTGLGDPVVEELRKRKMVVDGFIFTRASRGSLIEGLVVACDNRATRWGRTGWETLRQEMESFEYVLDDHGNVTYGAPEHLHDDTVMAAALAVRAAHRPTGVMDYYSRAVEPPPAMTEEERSHSAEHRYGFGGGR